MGSTNKTKALSVRVLLENASCCGNGCLNCPYLDKQGRRHIKGSSQVNDAFVISKTKKSAD